MRHRPSRALLLLALLLPAACAAGKASAPPPAPEVAAADAAPCLLVSQAAGEPSRVALRPAEPGRVDFEAFPARRRHVLAGFGGTFNEKGWDALQALSPEARAGVLRRLFAPGAGLALGMGRIPIGASDYALSRYALDETPGDLAMERFSVARDRKALLPYVQAARALNPALRLWASAWTPPPWMKSPPGYDGGRMRDEPALYAAYALYLSRFVEAYRDEGARVEAVAVQDEPLTAGSSPSCRWEPAQFRTFVRDHLGPTLARRSPGARVMLGTFRADDLAHALAVLEDPAARGFVGVLGVQWDGLPVAAAARKLAPALPVWHTESDGGNRRWERGFDAERAPNDFAYALDTWRKVRRHLDGGAEAYTLWNLVLDETGKGIDAEGARPENSPVVVNRATGEVTYTPVFQAVQQWSRYAGAGAVVLEGSGTNDALALARPDGNVAVQLVNPGDVPRSLRIKVGGRAWSALLPPRSFATLIVPAA